MVKKSDLKLNCMAIGSLPHKNIDDAMNLVKKDFSQIPFWPQLAKLNRNEDMILQFLENMPGVVTDKVNEKTYLDNESDEFFEQLESLFMDYEEIISAPSSAQSSILLEKYAITPEYSCTVNEFFKIVKETKPKFAKGQVVGPFTLATSLTDKENKCAFYDETLREIIVKTLSLKAIWQIKKIREACSETTPIIFIDEPSISQLGTSAYITISEAEVVGIIKELSDIIKQYGGISAIHCCGKCDWNVPIQIDVDIINLDGFFFAQNLSLFSEKLKPFLENGGIIAWGIIPTLDKEALESSNLHTMLEKFEEAIGYLTNKGVDSKLILNNSMITPSCGAGSLSVELAHKAMDLTKEVSKKLKEKFSN